MFVVGLKGAIAHYNGKTWAAMVSGTTESVSSVIGFGPTDVFAAAKQGGVLQYNGSGWSALSTWPKYTAANNVWGMSPSDLLVVGSSKLWYWAFSSWQSKKLSATINGVWGSSNSDVYFAHSTGISYYNGLALAAEKTDCHCYLYGVWGTDPKLIYAVGTGGTILRKTK